jgi:RNA polymerase sigma-70 factor (ECF subfamily)
VYRLARRILGHDADADEVTQDVFVQVLRKLPTYRGTAAFTTWLHRVPVNAALAYRRRQAVRATVPLPAELPARPAGDADQGALDREARQRVRRAVAALPAAYRAVVELADLEDLPNPAVAARLGLSVPAVKSRLHRARRLLRRAAGV